MDHHSPAPSPGKDILTGPEVESLLHVSRTTLWKLREKDKLPYTKVGRKYLYIRAEVLAWLKDQRGRGSQLTIPLEFSIEGGKK
jgi:excisionase family DNA binding protein